MMFVIRRRRSGKQDGNIFRGERSVDVIYWRVSFSRKDSI